MYIRLQLAVRNCNCLYNVSTLGV